jgi:hypothetical protein
MENNNINNNEQECWVPVPDEPYNKSFMISNFGKIKNINTDKIKTLSVNKATGYCSVRLDVGKKVKKITYQIHQLVAQMFIGECPDKHNVCHIDGNKENNRVSNLKYMTQSESMNRYFNKPKENKTETKTEIKQIDIIKLIGGSDKPEEIPKKKSKDKKDLESDKKDSDRTENKTEDLKPIKYYPNYLIDKKGNVYTAETMIIKKPQPNPNGYQRITLSKNQKRKNLYVHRIVAETFIENPDNLPFVNHKDANRKNNCVENLEWCTAQQNMSHDSKLRKTGKKIQSFTSDGKFVKEFESIKEAGRKLKIDSTSITKAVGGKNNRLTAGGFIWKYIDESESEHSESEHSEPEKIVKVELKQELKPDEKPKKVKKKQLPQTTDIVN